MPEVVLGMRPRFFSYKNNFKVNIIIEGVRMVSMVMAHAPISYVSLFRLFFRALKLTSNIVVLFLLDNEQRGWILLS